MDSYTRAVLADAVLPYVARLPNAKGDLRRVAAAAYAAHMAAGGRVQVGTPCLRRHKPHAPRSAMHAN